MGVSPTVYQTQSCENWSLQIHPKQKVHESIVGEYSLCSLLNLQSMSISYLIDRFHYVWINWCQNRVLFRELRIKICGFFFIFLQIRVVIFRKFHYYEISSYNLRLEGRFDSSFFQIFPFYISEEWMVFYILLSTMRLAQMQNQTLFIGPSQCTFTHPRRLLTFFCINPFRIETASYRWDD